jgi:hypothetical protein
MRSQILATLAGLFSAVAVSFGGQPPRTAEPPVVEDVPPVSPAYRHFMNSTASHKTYSAIRPGYGMTRAMPHAADGWYVEPGFFRQRVTPRGFEQESYRPGYGAWWQTPWGSGGYRVPGVFEGFRIPAPPSNR